MSALRKHIESTIRQREFLIRKHYSKRDVMRINGILKPLKNWLQAYPNASDENVLNWASRHAAHIDFLIPGNEAGKTRRKEFYELINAYEKSYDTGGTFYPVNGNGNDTKGNIHRSQ